ncbi:hypothetical protein BH24ACT26_BH24ACT26_05130 [soil metagenome]
MALERLPLIGTTRQPGCFGFGPGDDRSTDMWLEGDMQMHHAPLIAVAASNTGLVLPTRQVVVLFGFEFYLASPFFQNVEGLVLSQWQQFLGRARATLLRLGDLGGLIQRDLSVSHSIA